jgi:hypothetical protein
MRYSSTTVSSRRDCGIGMNTHVVPLRLEALSLMTSLVRQVSMFLVSQIERRRTLCFVACGNKWSVGDVGKVSKAITYPAQTWNSLSSQVLVDGAKHDVRKDCFVTAANNCSRPTDAVLGTTHRQRHATVPFEPSSSTLSHRFHGVKHKKES